MHWKCAKNADSKGQCAFQLRKFRHRTEKKKPEKNTSLKPCTILHQHKHIFSPKMPNLPNYDIFRNFNIKYVIKRQNMHFYQKWDQKNATSVAENAKRITEKMSQKVGKFIVILKKMQKNAKKCAKMRKNAQKCAKMRKKMR